MRFTTYTGFGWFDKNVEKYAKWIINLHTLSLEIDTLYRFWRIDLFDTMAYFILLPGHSRPGLFSPVGPYEYETLNTPVGTDQGVYIINAPAIRSARVDNTVLEGR